MAEVATPVPISTLPSSHPPASKSTDMKPPPSPKVKRPDAPERQPSATMIVSSDQVDIEAKSPREFPPDDARAMSPRQSNENLATICSESRERIQSETIEHQSSLAALIEKIESVKTGHEKLERDNNALQEYIGGLTRSMSKTDLVKGKK